VDESSRKAMRPSASVCCRLASVPTSVILAALEPTVNDESVDEPPAGAARRVSSAVRLEKAAERINESSAEGERGASTSVRVTLVSGTASALASGEYTVAAVGGGTAMLGA
jgi:hypothetical protein